MTDPALCWAVHLDGAQQADAGGRDVVLPTYGANFSGRAVHDAQVLKCAEPDALVTIVVWTDDGEDWIARTREDAERGQRVVESVAAQLRRDREARA